RLHLEGTAGFWSIVQIHRAVRSRLDAAHLHLTQFLRPHFVLQEYGVAQWPFVPKPEQTAQRQASSVNSVKALKLAKRWLCRHFLLLAPSPLLHVVYYLLQPPGLGHYS